jgi:hypothetical protein
MVWLIRKLERGVWDLFLATLTYDSMDLNTLKSCTLKDFDVMYLKISAARSDQSFLQLDERAKLMPFYRKSGDFWLFYSMRDTFFIVPVCNKPQSNGKRERQAAISMRDYMEEKHFVVHLVISLMSWQKLSTVCTTTFHNSLLKLQRHDDG